MDSNKPIRQTIHVDAMNPSLIFAHYFVGEHEHEPGKLLDERMVYNYEMEFFIKKDGYMLVNNQRYDLTYGDIIFRKPGDTTRACMPYDCYGLFFDIGGKRKRSSGQYFGKHKSYLPLYQNSFLDKLPTYFHTDQLEVFHQMFEEAFRYFIYDETHYEIMVKSLLLRILYLLYEEHTSRAVLPEIVNSTKYKKIQQTLLYIEEHLEEELSLQVLASHVNFSTGHFQKLFCEMYQMTPNQYITKVRLRKAKELLVTSSDNVLEIGLMCGFQSIQYFSYVFKKHIGCSPNRYRKEHLFY